MDFSSSKLRTKADGTEDEVSSRRVEFRIKTKVKERIVRIIEELN